MNCRYCKAEWTPPSNVSLTKCPFCQKPLIEINEIEKESKPDQVLFQITERYGVSILGDKRLSAILKDLMPHTEKKYQRIFSQAVSDGVGKKLLALESEDDAMRTVKIHTIKEGFKTGNGFDDTANYVIDCFLFSLGWIDIVEENDISLNLKAENIIKSSLEDAMSDGCLSTDKTSVLFSLGVHVNLSEETVAKIIIDAIKQKGFIPDKVIDTVHKSQKEILCNCNWYSESYLKKNAIEPVDHQSEKKNEKLLEILESLKRNSSIKDNIIKIGNQIWMKKNLDIVRFRNGDLIPEARSDEEWVNAQKNHKPAWCYYNNEPANGKKYGKLYNWYAVYDPRGLAPGGWHIPTDKEWSQLTDFLGGEPTASGKLKEAGSSHWKSAEHGVTNDTFFTALPGGCRSYYNGSFSYIGYGGYWWSATEGTVSYAWYRYIFHNDSNVFRDFINKANGFSVRCLRD